MSDIADFFSGHGFILSFFKLDYQKLNKRLKIVLLFKICSKIIVLQQHDATVAPDIFGILKL
jgi:hypothetical protein